MSVAPGLYSGYTVVVKTAISIPDDLHARADALAQRLQVSRSELYARAVEGLLRKHDEERMRAALDEVYTSESSDLPAGAAAAQAETVAAWED